MTLFKISYSVIHRLPPQVEPFEGARDELRKGRPLLAAFPCEIWQALPPGFIAALRGMEAVSAIKSS